MKIQNGRYKLKPPYLIMFIFPTPDYCLHISSTDFMQIETNKMKIIDKYIPLLS